MVLRLPLARPFLPARLRWRIADNRIEGPGGLGTPPERITTDGGGWWVAELGDMAALTPAEHRALRAFASRMRRRGVIDVPFLEQAPLGGLVTVPFSDGATFSDGAPWVGGAVTAMLETAAALRDDEALIRITHGPTLHPMGDVFSLDRGPLLGSELHVIEEATQEDANLWRVVFGTPLRQDWPAGAGVNFNDPHCAMRIADTAPLWGEFTRGWNTRSSAVFEEANL